MNCVLSFLLLLTMVLSGIAIDWILRDAHGDPREWRRLRSLARPKWRFHGHHSEYSEIVEKAARLITGRLTGRQRGRGNRPLDPRGVKHQHAALHHKVHSP
jgi:hypothetical protein